MMLLSSLCLWVYRAAAETGQSLRSSLQLAHSLGCTGLHQWRPAGSGHAPRPAMGMITCCAPRLLCTQMCCVPGQVGPLCPSVIWALVVADLHSSLVFRYWVVLPSPALQVSQVCSHSYQEVVAAILVCCTLFPEMRPTH